VTLFNANAITLCHRVIPGQLPHLSNGDPASIAQVAEVGGGGVIRGGRSGTWQWGAAGPDIQCHYRADDRVARISLKNSIP